MTTKGKEVAVHRLHIDLEMGCALGSIHHHRNAMLMSYLDNLLHRIDGSQHVTHMGYANQLCFS